jgi:hypothetical protein
LYPEIGIVVGITIGYAKDKIKNFTSGSLSYLQVDVNKRIANINISC